MDEASLARAPIYFPLAGALVGLVVASADHALAFLPIGIRSVITCVLLFAVSGGLHMDGVADTADGLLSGKPREEALRIMRDSRSGPMGVAAVAFLIIFKVRVIESLPADARFPAIFFMPIAGRAALTLTLSFFRYARQNGRALAMASAGRIPGVVAAMFLLIGGAVLLGWVGFSVAIATVFFAAVFGVYVKHRLGGYTGDTLGMICELTEAMAGLIIVATLR